MCRTLLLVPLALTAGCTTVRAPRTATPPAPRIFSHALFDRVLQRHVDDQGRVDYAALRLDRTDLDAYFRLVETFSPDSHAEQFPSAAHRLAYWINAYNAAVIVTVLHYYPIAGVGEIGVPLLPRFLTGKAGFFLFQRLTFGGETTSLYYLEHGVVRARFQEPRMHFALNCAARGCPRLPRRAFSGENLDAELEREARRFFAEERNLRIEHESRTVYLSSILDWFEGDFTEWLAARHPEREPTLIAYASLYAPPARAEELERAADYHVRFVPYDWRLNGRAE